MTAATAPDTMEGVREYAALQNEKGGLKDRLAAIDARLADLEPTVLDWFQRNGVDRVRVDDRTLSLRRELWAGRAEGVDTAAACAALVAAGLPEFAEPRVNTQSLSALLREREKSGEPAVPPELEGVIVANEVFKIGSRRA